MEAVDTDIPVEIKQALLDQEIKMWTNTRYITQVRLRVQKALNDTDQQAALIKELERIEIALDKLHEERHQIEDGTP